MGTAMRAKGCILVFDLFGFPFQLHIFLLEILGMCHDSRVRFLDLLSLKSCQAFAFLVFPTGGDSGLASIHEARFVFLKALDLLLEQSDLCFKLTLDFVPFW